jgi:hypothetical protein
MLTRSFLLLSAALLGSAVAQNPPKSAWSTVGSSEVKAGNGLFADPSGSTVVGSFLDGSLVMYAAATGNQTGTYVPAMSNGTTRGFGGVTFSYTGTNPYIVYAVTDNPTGSAQT